MAMNVVNIDAAAAKQDKGRAIWEVIVMIGGSLAGIIGCCFVWYLNALASATALMWIAHLDTIPAWFWGYQAGITLIEIMGVWLITKEDFRHSEFFLLFTTFWLIVTVVDIGTTTGGAMKWLQTSPLIAGWSTGPLLGLSFLIGIVFAFLPEPGIKMFVLFIKLAITGRK